MSNIIHLPAAPLAPSTPTKPVLLQNLARRIAIGAANIQLLICLEDIGTCSRSVDPDFVFSIVLFFLALSLL